MGCGASSDVPQLATSNSCPNSCEELRRSSTEACLQAAEPVEDLDCLFDDRDENSNPDISVTFNGRTDQRHEGGEDGDLAVRANGGEDAPNEAVSAMHNRPEIPLDDDGNQRRRGFSEGSEPRGSTVCASGLDPRRVPSRPETHTLSIDRLARRASQASSSSSGRSTSTSSVESWGYNRSSLSFQSSTFSDDTNCGASGSEDCRLSHLQSSTPQTTRRRISAGRSFNATEVEAAAGLDEDTLDLFVSVVNASNGEDPHAAALTRRALRSSRAWAPTTTAATRRVNAQ
jgi:hypothetical protein